MTKTVARPITVPATGTGTGTRDAVESSIDASKNDKQSTWEQSANRRLANISRWETKTKHTVAAADDCP